MSTEQLAGAAVLFVIGPCLIAVGALGRRGSLQYVLGGWTKPSATHESWARAHRTIGSAFLLGGVVAQAGALAVLVVPDRVTGPVVVTTAIALLLPVVVGVVRGTNQLERS